MRAAVERRSPALLRWLPSPLFAVVIVSLVLPFVSVSCQSGETDVEVLRFRGYHLLTGGEPELNPDVAPAVGERGVDVADLGPQPFAIVATALALAGVATGLLAAPWARLASAAAALVGLASLLLLRLRIGSQVEHQAAARANLPAAVTADVELGYWVAFAGFALALAATVTLIVLNAPRPARGTARRRSRRR